MPLNWGTIQNLLTVGDVIMTTPMSLDQRIAALVPELDETLRAELQQSLQTLRDVGNPVGVLLALSRLSLRLTKQLYRVVGREPPSDNLFDRIEKAVQAHVLPVEMASCTPSAPFPTKPTMTLRRSR